MDGAKAATLFWTTDVCDDHTARHERARASSPASSELARSVPGTDGTARADIRPKCRCIDDKPRADAKCNAKAEESWVTSKTFSNRLRDGHLLGFPFACEVDVNSACKHTFAFSANEDGTGEDVFGSAFACGRAEKYELALHDGSASVCRAAWYSLVILHFPLLFLYFLQVYMVLHFVQLRCSDASPDVRRWDVLTDWDEAGNSDWDEFSDIDDDD